MGVYPSSIRSLASKLIENLSSTYGQTPAGSSVQPNYSALPAAGNLNRFDHAGSHMLLQDALSHFDQIDVDGNGLLSAEDITSAITRVGNAQQALTTLQYLLENFAQVAGSHARTQVRTSQKLVQPERTMKVGKTSILLPPVYSTVRETVVEYSHAISREDITRKLSG